MATTPAPFPVYTVHGRHNRGFRHQVLGFPMTMEWLKKRSMELFGTDDIYRAAMRLIVDFEIDRPLHAVYDSKTDEIMLILSMAENLSPATVRDPPEKEVEWFRNYLGVTGRPLWYDVSD